jgi:hypothetical protein
MDALKPLLTLGAFIERLQSEFGIKVKVSQKESASASGKIYRPRSLIRLVPPAGKIVVPLQMEDNEVLEPAMVVFLCKRLRIPSETFGVSVH